MGDLVAVLRLKGDSGIIGFVVISDSLALAVIDKPSWFDRELKQHAW